MKHLKLGLASFCGACMAAMGGCCPPRTASATRPAAASPATRPATQPTREYTNAQYGLKLIEPAGYVPKPSNDYDLLLVPAGSPATPVDSLSLDVPDLPVHIPGLIPLNLVVNGYIDDLKKAHPGLVTDQNQDYKMPAAKACLVQTHWPNAGTTDMEKAILMVHGDHVFILRASADTAGQSQTLAGFDAFAKSLQWKK